jgi:hypothetical protein
MKVVSLSALGPGRLYLQEIFLILISVRGWVDHRAIVRPERICQWKSPMTPLKIDPASFRFVAQCNQASYNHLINYIMACVHIMGSHIAYIILKYI